MSISINRRDVAWHLPLLLVPVYYFMYDNSTLIYASLIVFSYIAAVTDYRTKTVPNRLIIIMLGYWVVFSGVSLLTDAGPDSDMITNGILGFLISGGVFFLLYIVSKKGIGAGDVKFIAASGLYMGGTLIFAVVLISFIVVFIFMMVLIVARRKTRKDSIVFVPFYFLGILLVLLL